MKVPWIGIYRFILCKSENGWNGRKKTIRMALIMLEQQKQMASSIQEADGAFLLDLSKATESYLRKHRQTNLACVIQYLLHDEHFPSSVMFCFNKLEEAFMHIEKDHLSARFLAVNNPLKALLVAMINIDVLTITLEEAIFFNGGKIVAMYRF